MMAMVFSDSSNNRYFLVKAYNACIDNRNTRLAHAIQTELTYSEEAWSDSERASLLIDLVKLAYNKYSIEL